MRILLDTGIFWMPETLARLRESRATVVVPAVAYAERIRHLASQNRDVAPFTAFLDECNWTVEPYGAPEAERLLTRLGHLGQKRWERLARDALVAGHVKSGDKLWTTNPDDFLELGLTPSQVVTVAPSP